MSFSRDDDSWAGRDDGYRQRPPGPSRRPRDREGRMRSRSPPAIDRYQPRARGLHERRDDQTYRRRSPPPAQGNIDRYVPGQGQGQEPIQLINPLANPLTADSQVGFSYFAEWWRKDKEIKAEKERTNRGERRPPTRLKSDQEIREEKDAEHEKIQAAYDDYKNKHQAQLGRQFVVVHKHEEWFKEKYDSDARDPFRKRHADYKREVYAQWEADLESGMFDEFSLEGIYKNDSNGEGGMIDKEEGEAAAANEVLGVGDLLPLKGGDLRDEAISQPALLIKTIAPYVSREKLEAFCKEHLGEGEGGLKWLSLSDPLPLKKFHRLGWVLLNPGGEQTVEIEVKAERGDGRDEDGEDGEDGVDKMETSGTETVTKSGAEIALEAINGKAIEATDKGSFTCHVGAHTPPPIVRKKALWDLFSAPERVERDLQLAVRLVMKLESEIGDDINAVSKIEERVEAIKSSGLLQPQTNGTSAQHKVENGDGEADEDGEMEEDEEGAYDEEVDDEELLSKKKRLDLLVEYLRRVHSFCFFCVFESDSVHELTRKCPGGHLRRPRASLTNQAKIAAKASAYSEPFPLKKSDTADQDVDIKEEGSPDQRRYNNRYNKKDRTFHQLQRAFNWVKTYESKLYQILEPAAVDIKELGGELVEEALEKNLKKHVTQEDESKFRCKVPDCSKLFKGENFWRKHLEKRHTEWFEKQKKDIQLINNYLMDPAHISPTTLTGQVGPGGHGFTSNNAMPTGTPRGFNLATMQVMSSMGAYTGMPPPIPPMFGGYPVTVPNPMAYNNGAFGADPSMMMGGVGPMRRGGGRFGGGNRMVGPYDRQQTAGGRRGFGAAGRGMSGGGMGRPGRFPDAAPGGMAMGPQEATQGRALKSYEDLDAVSGAEGAELDY